MSGPADAAGELLAPLQRQAEQLERVLQRQLEFERRSSGTRWRGPAALDIFEQDDTGDGHAQAKGCSVRRRQRFEQVAELWSRRRDDGEAGREDVRDPVAHCA